MFIQSFLVIPSLSLLLATLISACSPSDAHRADIARDPASYQHVMAVISEAEKTQAAGDDLTLYIGKDFAETERLAMLAHAEPARRNREAGRTD